MRVRDTAVVRNNAESVVYWAAKKRSIVKIADQQVKMANCG